MRRSARPLPVTAHSLVGVVLLRELSAEDRGVLAARCKGFQFKTSELIIPYKDQSNDVYFVVSGKVRATLYTYNGKKVSFREIEAGHVFGEWAAIDGAPRSANVVALTDTFVASMSAETFKDVVTRHPTIAWTLLSGLVQLARRLTDRVVQFSSLAVASRLHLELLRLAREGSMDDGTALIAAMPTNDELASRISTRREAVNRELRHLEKLGLIERTADGHVITDMMWLEDMVREALGE